MALHVSQLRGAVAGQHADLCHDAHACVIEVLPACDEEAEVDARELVRRRRAALLHSAVANAVVVVLHLGQVPCRSLPLRWQSAHHNIMQARGYQSRCQQSLRRLG
jgi:hypothetical protein